ncbi:MAG: DUF1698 domain-containing protein [Saprospiraceae bacterium]|nr:DUF1698 domain-containing protein [Saprospiraceae bacterium]
MMNTSAHLLELYRKTSKHSNYQVLPTALKKFIALEESDVKSRYEFERFEFIKTKLDLKGRSILDIGGNTGFFAFEAIDAGASEVLLVEGNKAHANFVAAAIEHLNSKIEVRAEFLDFDNYDFGNRFEIVLLLNVLHHYGDDFGGRQLTMDTAKEMMIKVIRSMSEITDYLVLQLGFCWKGDRSQLLFEQGTKREMIDFVRDAAQDRWEIEYIGVAEVVDGKTKYVVPTNENLRRNDAIGEFRNRPIFILKRRV